MSAPILSIETATAHKDAPASVALQVDEHVDFHALKTPNSQAAQLVSTIEALLRDRQLWYDDLSQLIVTVGPGGFTGIRIGLAVARSIAFACPALQLTAVTTLEAMAARYDGSERSIRAVMRAGKGELFHQVFSRKADIWQAASDIGLCPPDALPNDAPLFGNGLEGRHTAIDARAALAALGAVSLSPREAVPLYIRPPDAKPQFPAA